MLTGNWGFSFFGGRPVLNIVFERVPATLELMGSSITLAIIVGVSIGILGAVRRYSIFDYLATSGAMVALSLPTFWFGLIAIFIFSQQLRWLPAGGMQTLGSSSGVLDNLKHLILPMLVLALVLVAQWSRYTRSAMLEVLHQDYMRTARAKGLAQRATVLGHGFRNALLPLVTLAGLQLPVLFGGALVTETVFSWPGMGLLFVTSLSMRDYPVLMALLMMTAVLVIMGNFLADLAAAVVDPRIRLHT
jgi:peptide/nickel transport system permease protein